MFGLFNWVMSRWKCWKKSAPRSGPANNGVEALELLRQTKFDCVLMDVQMPQMDGLEATRRIRADPQLAHMRVLAMTATATTEARVRCIDAGMNDFISKPIQ